MLICSKHITSPQILNPMWWISISVCSHCQAKPDSYEFKTPGNLHVKYKCCCLLLLPWEWHTNVTTSMATNENRCTGRFSGELFNSLAPGRSECDSKNVIFNLILLIGIFKSSNGNVLRWMPQDLTDDKSTLVQVMAWCHQAASHYLNQCWPKSPMSYGVTRPQWVKYKWCCLLLLPWEWYTNITTSMATDENRCKGRFSGDLLIHWPLRNLDKFYINNFQANFSHWWLRYFWWVNCP